MILKKLDCRQGKEQNYVVDEWNYFDNIVTASVYFDEGSQSTVVRCVFRDENCITILISNVAYLMSDTGQTIEKIIPAKVKELGDSEPVNVPLPKAVEAAKD